MKRVPPNLAGRLITVGVTFALPWIAMAVYLLTTRFTAIGFTSVGDFTAQGFCAAIAFAGAIASHRRDGWIALLSGVASSIVALAYADRFMLTFIGMTTGHWL